MLEIIITSKTKNPDFFTALEGKIRTAVEEARMEVAEVRVKTEIIFNPNL